MQVMTEAEAAAWERDGWNPFDLTKVWPHKDFPRIPVGVLELNRNPENYHAEVEQAAFSPANVVPGMGYSPGQDAAGAPVRLPRRAAVPRGHEPPAPAGEPPRCPFHNQQRDGAMAFNGNFGSAHNYDPSTVADAPAQNPAYREPPVPLSGEPGDKYDHRTDEDYYSQAGALYRLIPAAEKDRLTTNIARALHGIPQHIIIRQLQHFTQADAAYGRQVAEKLRVLASA